MRLYTSVSDKFFLAALLISASALAYTFYYLAERFSETMLMEKSNWRVASLKIEAPLSEFAVIGTSHADSHLMPDNMHYIRLTGGHNLPPAMYYESKALLEYPTSLKVVYIEADDHVFMNGPSYGIKKTSDTAFTESPMYRSWHDYFDEEGKATFGASKENTALHELLSLQPDIKPILLKRITQKIFERLGTKNSGGNHTNSISTCTAASTIQQPDISKDTYWSRLQGQDRSFELIGRLSGFSLDKPSPISPLMTEYYEKTIQLFLDHGISVVLVRFPMAPDFQKGIHPENTKAIAAYLDNLRKKNNIPMLDLTYLTEKGDRFFENEDHVHHDFFPLIGQLIIKDFCENRQ